MKKAALALTAALLLALVAPVFAQPFADVPTDHWAYDAIAELAAKGLVEGYPDGTFKGDRALTRYEMAMIVARLLARIEAVAAQIPGPPPPPPAPPKPEVTKADLDKISALVREFQTDLQALGVRIESIEEELRNLRGQLDKTKWTGSLTVKGTITSTGAPTYTTETILAITGSPATNVTAYGRLRAVPPGLGGTISPTLDQYYIKYSGPFFGLEPVTFTAGRFGISFGQGLAVDTAKFGARLDLALAGLSLHTYGVTAVSQPPGGAFGVHVALPTVGPLSLGASYTTYRTAAYAVEPALAVDFGLDVAGIGFTGEYTTFTTGGVGYGSWVVKAKLPDLAGIGLTLGYRNVATSLPPFSGFTTDRVGYDAEAKMTVEPFTFTASYLNYNLQAGAAAGNVRKFKGEVSYPISAVYSLRGFYESFEQSGTTLGAGTSRVLGATLGYTLGPGATLEFTLKNIAVTGAPTAPESPDTGPSRNEAVITYTIKW